jgi:hypothetical protein
MCFKLEGECGTHSPPPQCVFFKSFLENKKDRGKGTQNEEGRKVKTKGNRPEMYWTFSFLALRIHECEGGVR